MNKEYIVKFRQHISLASCEKWFVIIRAYQKVVIEGLKRRLEGGSKALGRTKSEGFPDRAQIHFRVTKFVKR